MSGLSHSRKMLMHGAVMTAVLCGFAAGASADQVTVHKSVDVLSDKNPFSDPVESVAPEAKMERIGTEGSWIKVRTAGGKEGYVTSDDIAPPRDLSGVTANNSVDNATAGLAGRGLGPESQKFAQEKNLKQSGLNAMLATGKSVSRKDVRDFAKAGHVGPAKYRDSK